MGRLLLVVRAATAGDSQPRQHSPLRGPAFPARPALLLPPPPARARGSLSGAPGQVSGKWWGGRGQAAEGGTLVVGGACPTPTQRCEGTAGSGPAPARLSAPRTFPASPCASETGIRGHLWGPSSLPRKEVGEGLPRAGGEGHGARGVIAKGHGISFGGEWNVRNSAVSGITQTCAHTTSQRPAPLGGSYAVVWEELVAPAPAPARRVLLRHRWPQLQLTRRQRHGAPAAVASRHQAP